MEFDDIKKVWHSQDSIHLINENAMHNSIMLKKKQARHIINVSELLSIIVNLLSGCLLLALNLSKTGSVAMFVLAAWMFCVGLFLWIARIRRQRGDLRFDRSLRGDLLHAVSAATYQVRLSQLMRWNILPIAILTIIGVWNGGKSNWLSLTILLFFAAAFYASGWEHDFYKKRKRALEELQSKLEGV